MISLLLALTLSSATVHQQPAIELRESLTLTVQNGTHDGSRSGSLRRPAA